MIMAREVETSSLEARMLRRMFRVYTLH